MSSDPSLSKIDSSDNDPITIRTLSQDGTELHFKMRPNSPLEKLILAYCQRQSIAKSMVRFMYNGIHVQETDTAKSLEMESGDSIDVMIEQTGG